MESNETGKIERLSIKRLLAVLLIFMLIAVIIEAGVSLCVLRKDTSESTALFLNQVETVLDNNEKKEQEQLDELKETYMISAQAAAYILSAKPNLIVEISELKRIAGLLSVDEIHIFDETGRIIGGTNPEYYGYTFDSGEQMSFFKPMLEDKTLSMCQNVTPNTANDKNMMYAITWDSKGKFMVQVGVEPKRLITTLKANDIRNVISSIPITEGYDIYALDPETYTIIAASNEEVLGSNISETNNIRMPENVVPEKGFCHLGDKFFYINYREIGDYLITISYDLSFSNNSLLVPIIINIAYLFIAGVVIILIVLKSRRREEKKNEAILAQYKVLLSLSDIYYSMHLINLRDDTNEEFKSQGVVKRLGDKRTDAAKQLRQIMTYVTDKDYLDKALEFTDLSTLVDRMGDRKVLTCELVAKKIGWFRAQFIVVERDENNKPVKVIYATRGIDEEKKKEETLIYRSNTDELTGCYNRRVYEESIPEIEEKGMPDDFAYVSIDVNGLKVINDTLGHDAGDELIKGAGKCMKLTLEPYGKIFRTGGDEFVAFLETGDAKLSDLLKNFDNAVENWSGRRVDSLSVSYGCVSRAECPDASFHDIAILADKRMYEAKSAHYRAKGFDRRGQQDAHKALCSLYTKILKVNLTEDSYQIVNMNEDEQKAEKGFSDKISKWLSGFGTSGQVHPDDLEEYLRYTDLNYMKDYFTKKTSLHIFYRRKYEDGYKNVMMEIIPANDYSNENQSVFLYVKDIDK